MSQPDAYSPQPAKHERNFRTRTMSENNPKAFRKDAVRVASALNVAKIDCELEYIVPRIGEYAANGQEKFYSVDLRTKDPRYEVVAIEMEGKGSGSKDNADRDEYLMSHGFKGVLHYPNGTPSEEIIADLNRDFKKPETEFP